jgi:hypothetical protein
LEVCSVAVELEEPVWSVGALEESLLVLEESLMVLEGVEVGMVCYPRQP